MTDTRLFYCWVKVSKMAGESEAPAAANDGNSACILNGNVPPHILNGNVPPGARFGGSFASAWWAIDEEFQGIPGSGLKVEHAPTAWDRDDALNWLHKNPSWIDASVVTYFLMVFAAADMS